jgi:hypothetical protein
LPASAFGTAAQCVLTANCSHTPSRRTNPLPDRPLLLNASELATCGSAHP